MPRVAVALLTTGPTPDGTVAGPREDTALSTAVAVERVIRVMPATEALVAVAERTAAA